MHVSENGGDCESKEESHQSSKNGVVDFNVPRRFFDLLVH